MKWRFSTYYILWSIYCKYIITYCIWLWQDIPYTGEAELVQSSAIKQGKHTLLSSGTYLFQEHTCRCSWQLQRGRRNQFFRGTYSHSIHRLHHPLLDWWSSSVTHSQCQNFWSHYQHQICTVLHPPVRTGDKRISLLVLDTLSCTVIILTGEQC